MSPRAGSRRLLLAALAAAAAVLSACGGSGDEAAGPEPARDAPVVLISIDTLRADRLPAYGYSGVETPAFDALRRDAILFTNAWSQVPLTLPSHASALTGTLPPRHGVRDNLGYRLDVGDLPYLPRDLRALGYATGAAVSAFVLRGQTGLDAGFDFYEDAVVVESTRQLGTQQRPGDETLAAAVPWLRGVAGGPFFLFFHIYEPHTPYDPPEPFASRYAASAYDGEIAAADAIVGRLLEELRSLGLYDRSLILLFSDHGEALGEHGEKEHGVLLHREVMRVPLMVKLPFSDRGGTTVDRVVGLVDIHPTVVEAVGGSTAAGTDGRSLLTAPGPDAPPRAVYSETFYPRLHFGWSELASLTSERFRLIDGPPPELYDAVNDPGETRNVLREHRRAYGELRRELDALDRTLALPSEEDEETRQRLAALGYLGGTAAAGDGPLPHPKDRLHVFADLTAALRLLSAQQGAEAAEALRRVLAEEPGMVDAWEYLGQALYLVGDVEGSLEAYQRAMELSGGAPRVAMATATVLMALDRVDEARRHAQAALPAQEAAYDVLAQIALRENDLKGAERWLERALATRGTRVEPLVTAAQLSFRQGRMEEALQLTEQAEVEFGDRTNTTMLRGLHFIRGSAWAHLGEAEPAERAFLQSIELFPEDLPAYSRLALLYALQDRAQDAGQVLNRMVEANPAPRAYAEAVRTLRTLGDERLAGRTLEYARGRWPEDPELRELAG